MNGKFRVWNKKRKAYHDFEDLVIDMQGRLLDRDRRVLDPKENEVEFCTGREDYHGKEIYKGDIVAKYDEDISSFNNPSGLEIDSGSVEWGETSWGIMGHSGWEPDDLDSRVTMIIGNIHEVK